MMARATDRFQLSAMRANLLQACGLPDFDTFDVCSPAAYDFNLARLLLNNVNLKNWHKVGSPPAIMRMCGFRVGAAQNQRTLSAWQAPHRCPA